MFKVDWPCAICGVALGYYAKGKVVAIKETVKKISIDAKDSLKESFSDYEKSQASRTQATNTNTN